MGGGRGLGEGGAPVFPLLGMFHPKESVSVTFILVHFYFYFLFFVTVFCQQGFGLSFLQPEFCIFSFSLFIQPTPTMYDFTN